MSRSTGDRGDHTVARVGRPVTSNRIVTGCADSIKDQLSSCGDFLILTLTNDVMLN